MRTQHVGYHTLALLLRTLPRVQRRRVRYVRERLPRLLIFIRPCPLHEVAPPRSLPTLLEDAVDLVLFLVG